MNNKHIWITAAFILIAFNALIIQKELALANGESIYFELTPVDPRSLMQGDYMDLNYQVADDIRTNLFDKDHTTHGRIIIRIDENNVAHFQQFDGDKTPLKPNERYLKWRKASEFQISIGAPSYFFQEGRAEHFTQAKYAELKLSPAGKTLLVTLLDDARNPL